MLVKLNSSFGFLSKILEFSQNVGLFMDNLGKIWQEPCGFDEDRKFDIWHPPKMRTETYTRLGTGVPASNYHWTKYNVIFSSMVIIRLFLLVVSNRHLCYTAVFTISMLQLARVLLINIRLGIKKYWNNILTCRQTSQLKTIVGCLTPIH